MPTYDNAGTVLDMMLQLSKGDLHLLVVDDGSATVVQNLVPSELSQKITVLRHDQNMGKGAALRTAFQWARAHGYTHVVTVDSDGQHFAKDVPRLVELSRQNPELLILGRRDMDGPGAGIVPQSSRFGRELSDFWIWMETGKQVSDSQSGLRCYPVKSLPDHACWSIRYDFEVEIVARWLWIGGKTTSINIGVSYAKNRISSFKPLLDNTRITWLHIKLCILRILGAGLWFNKNPGTYKEVAGVGFLEKLLKFPGPGFCYTLLPFVSFFYWLISHQPRKNLLNFYRHLGIKGLCAYWQTYRNITSFALSILDRAAFAAGLITPNVTSVNETFSRDESGWILLGAHLGDWTFAGTRFSEQHGRKVLITINQLLSPKFQAIMKNAFAGRLTFVDLSADRLQTILTYKEVLDDGGYVCFMADRPAPNEPATLRIKFLGEDAYFSANIFRSIKAFRRPVKFFNCIRTSTSRKANYQLLATSIWDGVESIDEKEMALRYVRALEAAVKVAPRHWFNFYDYWNFKHTAASYSPLTAKEQNDRHNIEAHA